jgi:hypothetical protein
MTGFLEVMVQVVKSVHPDLQALILGAEDSFSPAAECLVLLASTALAEAEAEAEAQVVVSSTYMFLGLLTIQFLPTLTVQVPEEAVVVKVENEDTEAQVVKVLEVLLVYLFGIMA